MCLVCGLLRSTQSQFTKYSKVIPPKKSSKQEKKAENFIQTSGIKMLHELSAADTQVPHRCNTGRSGADPKLTLNTSNTNSHLIGKATMQVTSAPLGSLKTRHAFMFWNICECLTVYEGSPLDFFLMVQSGMTSRGKQHGHNRNKETWGFG